MQYSNDPLNEISLAARRAVQAQDWPTVLAGAIEILRRDPDSAEGHFLNGLVQIVSNKPAFARESFRKSLDLDCGRHDSAIELADHLILLLLLDFANIPQRSSQRVDTGTCSIASASRSNWLPTGLDSNAISCAWESSPSRIDDGPYARSQYGIGCFLSVPVFVQRCHQQ